MLLFQIEKEKDEIETTTSRGADFMISTRTTLGKQFQNHYVCLCILNEKCNLITNKGE